MVLDHTTDLPIEGLTEEINHLSECLTDGFWVSLAADELVGRNGHFWHYGSKIIKTFGKSDKKNLKRVILGRRGASYMMKKVKIYIYYA